MHVLHQGEQASFDSEANVVQRLLQDVRTVLKGWLLAFSFHPIRPLDAGAGVRSQVRFTSRYSRAQLCNNHGLHLLLGIRLRKRFQLHPGCRVSEEVPGLAFQKK